MPDDAASIALEQGIISELLWHLYRGGYIARLYGVDDPDQTPFMVQTAAGGTIRREGDTFRVEIEMRMERVEPVAGAPEQEG